MSFWTIPKKILGVLEAFLGGLASIFTPRRLAILGLAVSALLAYTQLPSPDNLIFAVLIGSLALFVIAMRR